MTPIPVYQQEASHLCKSEPGIGVVVGPDLEGFLTMAVIADEEYISHAIPIEVHCRVDMRI